MSQKIALEDYFERAKYVVTRNLFVTLTIILSILGIINFIQGDINMIPILGGAVSSAIVLAILQLTKKYKFAAIFAAILSALLTVYNLLIVSSFGHFIDFFWIVIVALYIFFTLGKKWGIANLFVNISIVEIILYLVRHKYIHQYPKELTVFSEVNFLINILIAGILFSYLMILMINQMRIAQEKYKLANQELSIINEEKTVMLKEIHHRVKNNLQVIMSLLRLQASEVNDEKTKFHLTDSVNRVSAMAMIHEKMYQSDNLAKLDLKIYLNSLIEDLIKSYASKTKINLTIESEIDNIDPKSIVPFALIFNELVSNSIKHGFENKEEGIIEIKIRRPAQNKILMTYFDNGIWKETMSESGSFGLEMIETFTEQLDGKLERSFENGTKYKFEFNAIL